MIDIFVSYSSKDRMWVEKLIEKLENHKFKIWCDLYIDIGSHYPGQIQKNLHDAKCIIVIWSKYSVESEWVYSEAEYALERKVLIPIIIDQSNIPVPFNTFQTLKFKNLDESFNVTFDRLLQIISKYTESNIRNESNNINNEVDFSLFVNLKKTFHYKQNSINKKDKDIIIKVNNKIYKLKHHLQYHQKFKTHIINKTYASIDFKSLHENYEELKKITALNILNFKKEQYTYMELVSLLTCKNNFNTDRYRVSEEDYYDIYQMCTDHGGEQLLFLDYITGNTKKCKERLLMLYEKNIKISGLGTAYTRYLLNYNFYYLENKIYRENKFIAITSNKKYKQLLELVVELFSTYYFPEKNNLVIYTKNKKYGLCDINKNILLKAKYDYINDYSEVGFLTTYYNEKQGLIDKDGNILIKPQFDTIYSFNFDMYKIAVIINKGKFGLINKEGDILLYPKYDNIKCTQYARRSFAYVKKDFKLGIVNTQGVFIKKLSYIRYLRSILEFLFDIPQQRI